jgi:hypothetical protein
MSDTFESLSFFRGISSPRLIQHPIIKNVRRDRKPRNMPENIHQRANMWFFSKFGVNYRSEALFITSSLLTAQSYASSPDNVVRVIPLGPYRYCWSPKRSDLLFYCSTNETVPIEQYLEESNYIEKNLNEAYETGNEVMLFCERYIVIPVVLLDELAEDPKKNCGSMIVLP